MARPLRIEFKGALYHILSRGNEGCDIFFRDVSRAFWFKMMHALCSFPVIFIKTLCEPVWLIVWLITGGAAIVPMSTKRVINKYILECDTLIFFDGPDFQIKHKRKQ